MKKIIFLLFFITSLISCNTKKKEVGKVQEQSVMSVKYTHKPLMLLDSETKPKVLKWKEYSETNDFIVRFQNISPNEAINNALELKGYVKNLKDSIRIDELKVNPFKVRVNVLENETLRLVDMTYISAITGSEVNKQVTKLLEAFSAVNSKINTIYSQKRFEETIDGKDILIGLDSTKVDSISYRLNDKNLKNKKLVNLEVKKQ